MASLIISSLCTVAGQDITSDHPTNIISTENSELSEINTRSFAHDHTIGIDDNLLLSAKGLKALKQTVISQKMPTLSSPRPVISTGGTAQFKIITTKLALPTRGTRLHAAKSSTNWSVGRDRTGPYFEDGSELVNITAHAGTDIFLDCRVAMLHNKTVSWTRRHGGRLQLLTVGRAAWAADARLALAFRYPGNWRLAITPVQHGDTGLYECSVATHPPRAKVYNVTVVGPIVQILDESGRAITERYYLAGSEALLACSAVNLSDFTEDVGWRKNHRNLTREDGVTVSIDLIHKVGRATLALNTNNRTHAGNYTCAAGSAFATVYVHILQGVSVLPNTGTSGGNRIQIQGDIITVILLWALCSLIYEGCKIINQMKIL